MQKKMATRYMVQGAMIAAIYVALTKVFEPLSFGMNGAIQCRVSELLTVLPVFTPAAVPGLFVGCLIGNLLGAGASPVDIVFGSLTTLLAACGTRMLRKNWFLAVLPPIVLNGLIVGGYLPVVYGMDMPIWLSMVFVAAGQVISCGLGGLLLAKALSKTPVFKYS